MMKSDNRRSLSGGGAGSSPAFSAADVVLARAMGVQLEVELSPADVLGMRHATDTVLATIRSERAARMAAEKRVTALDAALTDALAWVADVQIHEESWAQRVAKWRRLALASVPVVAAQAMVILWLVVAR